MHLLGKTSNKMSIVTIFGHRHTNLIIFSYFDMFTIFSFGVTSNLSLQKSLTAEILGKYFLGTIVPRKYMPIISAVGLFCYDKFEETPNEKVVNMSKLTKPYFSFFKGDITGHP